MTTYSLISFHGRFSPKPILVLCLLFRPLSYASSFASSSRETFSRLRNEENSTTVTFEEARQVRTRLGHEAALALYQSLLHLNDLTAATRLAAAPDTPNRHDAACPLQSKQKIEELRELLLNSHYNHVKIQETFGVPRDKMLQASGPLYLKSPMAGSSTSSPLTDDDGTKSSSLQCLVTLFLLGIAVPRTILVKCLLGGEDSVLMLEELGLAFPCQTDANLVVPYVHVFPLDVTMMTTQHGDEDEAQQKKEETTTLYLVTDLHPRVLSTTTVGTHKYGTVMYIGPDSLALVQHHLALQQKQPNKHFRRTRILDVCAGSGVQALSTLMALQVVDPSATAVCVDCNERALKFTMFNAILNGFGDRVEVVWGDLISESYRRYSVSSADEHKKSRFLSDGTEERTSREESHLSEDLLAIVKDKGCYDVLLANPPFIPVPPQHKDIAHRYGLFSSGGSDGEEVLRGIVDLSTKVLKPSDGLLAIVSEFMNPPKSDIDVRMNQDDLTENGGTNDEELLHRMRQWWTTSFSSPKSFNPLSGCGVLFTNQYPVSGETYASRRADTPDEFEVWRKHLSKLHITHVSPGLLFIRTHNEEAGAANSFKSTLAMYHRLVPKSETGSIWTPSNYEAVAYTTTVLSELLF